MQLLASYVLPRRRDPAGRPASAPAPAWRPRGTPGEGADPKSRRPHACQYGWRGRFATSLVSSPRIRETPKVALSPLAAAAAVHESPKVAPRPCAVAHPNATSSRSGRTARGAGLPSGWHARPARPSTKSRCTEPALIRGSGFVEVACAAPRGERTMESRTEGNTLPSVLDCRGLSRSRPAALPLPEGPPVLEGPPTREDPSTPLASLTALRMTSTESAPRWSRVRAACEGRAMARPYGFDLRKCLRLGPARGVAPSGKASLS